MNVGILNRFYLRQQVYLQFSIALKMFLHARKTLSAKTEKFTVI